MNKIFEEAEKNGELVIDFDGEDVLVDGADQLQVDLEEGGKILDGKVIEKIE